MYLLIRKQTYVVFYGVAASLTEATEAAIFVKSIKSNVNLFLLHFFPSYFFLSFLICFVLKKVAWYYKNGFPAGFLQFSFKIKISKPSGKLRQ